LHHKVQKKISSGASSPGWSQKKGRKTVVCVYYQNISVKRTTTYDAWSVDLRHRDKQTVVNAGQHARGVRTWHLQRIINKRSPSASSITLTINNIVEQQQQQQQQQQLFHRCHTV